MVTVFGDLDPFVFLWSSCRRWFVKVHHFRLPQVTVCGSHDSLFHFPGVLSKLSTPYDVNPSSTKFVMKTSLLETRQLKMSLTLTRTEISDTGLLQSGYATSTVCVVV